MKNLKKAISLEQCEFKLSGKDKGTFTGYASVFDVEDSYGDVVRKGAFLESIKSGRNIPGFVNHNSLSIPVIKYTYMEEDSKGLLVDGKIIMGHKDGPSLYAAMVEEAIDGLSIGYNIPKGGSFYNEEEKVNELTKIILKEVSAVNFPANDESRLTVVKSEIEDLHSLKEVEAFLRDSGLCSHSSAVALVSRIKSLGLSDSERKLHDEVTEQKKQSRIKIATGELIDFINKLEVK